MSSIQPLPDWHLIRRLLLNPASSIEPPASSIQHPSIPTIHRWLIIQQGWAIGDVAMKDGLPVSAVIHALTLAGHDWAALLADEAALTTALATLAEHKLRPSTALLESLLGTPQLNAIAPPRLVRMDDPRADKPRPSPDTYATTVGALPEVVMPFQPNKPKKHKPNSPA